MHTIFSRCCLQMPPWLGHATLQHGLQALVLHELAQHKWQRSFLYAEASHMMQASLQQAP